MFRFCLKLFSLGLLFYITGTSVSAQVGVGTPAPDPSAQLDVSSSSRGMLVPRLTATQKTQISNPAAGLLIYQTTDSAGFYYYSGAAWIRLLTQQSLPADITAQGNSFNTGGKLVQLHINGQLPAVDGSLLTNLSAGKISGIVPVSKGGTGTDSAFSRGSIVFTDATGQYRQNNNQFFWSNDSLRLGIGTRNPYSRLSLGHGASNKADSRIAVYEDEAFKGKYFYGMGLCDRFGMYGLGLWGGTGSALPGNGNDSTVMPHMMVNSFGYVGIGTMTPGTRLSVSGQISASDLRLYTGAAPKKILTSIDSLGNTQWTAPDQLTGLGAAAISSGTLNNARLSASVTLQGNSFNTAGQLVQLDAGSKLPAVDGSLLTNLKLGNITDTIPVSNGGTGVGTVFTKGSLVFAGTNGKYQQNNGKLFWDNDSARLGIGANTIGSALSLGTSTPNNFRSRIALFEDASSKFFYGLGLIKYDVYHGLGFWGGTGSSKPGDGFDSTIAPHLYVNNAGNVGIGTMMPGTRLEVGGTITATGFRQVAGAGAGRVMTADASGNTSWSPHMYVAGTGNIGIGTTQPATRLDVAGTTKTQAFQMTEGATAGYILRSDNLGKAQWVKPSDALSIKGSAFAITHPQPAGNEVALFSNYVVNRNSFSAYGVFRQFTFTAPYNGVINRVMFKLMPGGANAASMIGTRIIRNQDSDTVANGSYFFYAADGNNFWNVPQPIYVDSGTSYTLQFYKPQNLQPFAQYSWWDSVDVRGYRTESINALSVTGNTAKVSGKLALNNAAATVSAISLGTPAENTAAGQVAVFEDGTTGKYFYGMNLAKVGSSFGLGLYGSSDNAIPGDGVATGTRKPHLFISPAANIIEADLPAQFNQNVAVKGQLDLYGGVRFWDGATWRTLTIGNCGACTQVGYWVTSDRRFKTGIRSLGYPALDRISRISGYRYNYQNDSLRAHGYGTDSSNREQLGFIAQEIEPLFPELVRTDSAGYKSINYAQMTAVLVEAIKELKQENTQLRSDYSGLKAAVTSRMEELEQRLNSLLQPQQPTAGKVALKR